MMPYPHIRPYIFKIGPFEIRWYGLMYIFGFISSYLLFRYQVNKRKLNITKEETESLYFHMILGLIVGARLGYVVFYNLGEYIKNPLDVFAVWHGGMSFHGGAIGVLIAGIIFILRRKKDFYLVSDLVAATAPAGLFFGRMGNFINGELYGRPSDAPWAMIFPEGGPLPRHPSQLYEAGLEGVLLFIILWTVKGRIKTNGMLLSLFLVLYGIFRFIAEFFREPDTQLGFIWGSFTMGQSLSAGMIAAGVVLFALRKARGKASPSR
jgi:phosphatidylglycerol:prolipoprotein diacylglycerol transferase